MAITVSLSLQGSIEKSLCTILRADICKLYPKIFLGAGILNSFNLLLARVHLILASLLLCVLDYQNYYRKKNTKLEKTATNHKICGRK